MPILNQGMSDIDVSIFQQILLLEYFGISRQLNSELDY